MRIPNFEWMASEDALARNERRERKPGQSQECVCCHRPVDPVKSELVEMLVDGTLLLDEEPAEGDVESQGGFPIGPTCRRRVEKLGRPRG